jgi:hypothetical protein
MIRPTIVSISTLFLELLIVVRFLTNAEVVIASPLHNSGRESVIN